MRQQLGDVTCTLCWQSSHSVFQVSIWIMPVEPRRLDQTHDRGRSFAAAQRSGKQPINWSAQAPMS